MSPFSVLESLITKQKPLKERETAHIDPYMIQRYLSFIKNKGLVLLINNLINSKKTLFLNKFLFYNTCFVLIPKMKHQYISYIKKERKKKEKEESYKKTICNDFRISLKELEEYISIDADVLTEYKNSADLYKK